MGRFRIPGWQTAGLALVLVLGADHSWADEPFAPRFEFGASVFGGTAYELVLRDETYNNPISRLTWPITPSVGLEASVTLPWMTLTSTTITFSGAWAPTQGTIVDEDWNTGSLIYGRSEHDSVVIAQWSARIEQEFHIQDFTLGPGFLYRWSGWQGWNGSLTQQTSSGTTNSVVSGLVLAYRQQWLIPYFSVEWTWHHDDWSLVPGFRFGPYTWCFDQDDHLLASKRYTYLDDTAGGVYAQGSLEWSIRQSPSWAWGLRAWSEVAYGAAGWTTVTTPTVATTSVDFPLAAEKAGAWFYQFGVTTFVRN